jgi:hypothetical protein
VPLGQMVMSSIFVQIPSYHDYELNRTVRDAINKSSKLNFINFGIHVCYYETIDFVVPNGENIKIEISKGPQNIGVGKSRNIANSFYDGEDYYLQIDSHCRFEENWDESLINNYNKYKSFGTKPVISAYPGSYEYLNKELNIINNKFNVTYTNFVEELSFNNDLVPHQRAEPNFGNNVFTKSVSASSIFSDGSISDIPPNPDIYFWGEEILTALRFYTRGYDLMLPERQNVYHLYYNHYQTYENLRRQVGSDFPEKTQLLDQMSKRTLENIILNNKIGYYELGSDRTLEDYENYAKIDFKNKKIIREG